MDIFREPRAPIDLTWRKISKTCVNDENDPCTKVYSQIHICPVCSVELLDINAFIKHMTMHHRKPLPVDTGERKFRTRDHARSRSFVDDKNVEEVKGIDDPVRANCRPRELFLRAPRNHRRVRMLRKERQWSQARKKRALITLEIKEKGENALRTPLANQSPPEDLVFVCPTCPTEAQFTGRNQLHFETAHMRTMLVCTVCGLWFATKPLFSAHVICSHLTKSSVSALTMSNSLTKDEALTVTESNAGDTSNFLTPPTVTTIACNKPESAALLDPFVTSIFLSGLMLSQNCRLLPFATPSPTEISRVRDEDTVSIEVEARENYSPTDSKRNKEILPQNEDPPRCKSILTRLNELETRLSLHTTAVALSSVDTPVPNVTTYPAASSSNYSMKHSPMTSPRPTKAIVNTSQSSPCKAMGTLRKVKKQASKMHHSLLPPLMLFDHPLQRLLPLHVAVAIDRRTIAKICHFCFKEFTDEMTVLKHQVEVHRLEETQEAQKQEQINLRKKPQQFDQKNANIII